jgi:hypothetical protein
MHFLGQASWHAPQSTQADSLITLFCSPSCVIQPIIHTLWQVPQPTQSDLLILLGIIFSLNCKNYNVCLQESTVISNALVKNEYFSFIFSKCSPVFKNLAVPSSKNPVPI